MIFLDSVNSVPFQAKRGVSDCKPVIFCHSVRLLEKHWGSFQASRRPSRNPGPHSLIVHWLNHLLVLLSLGKPLHLSLGSGFLFSLVIPSCRKHSDLAFKEPVGPERVRSVSLFISFLTAAQGVGVLVAGHFTLCSISLVTRVSLWPIENKSLSLSPCSIPLI